MSYENDRAATLRSRHLLASNVNLVFWYRRLYEDQFQDVPDITSRNVLEIGSGVSPLALFYPTVQTSDILVLEYVDYVFDCHEIDKVTQIADASLDIITLTNVLHHLKDPLAFLINATKKLKPGGKVIATEPYFSTISSLIYKYMHREPVSFDIEEPLLGEITGPLESANIALPHLIFFSKRGWDRKLKEYYRFSLGDARYFTSLSYMVTGGISKRLPIPRFLYRSFFSLDLLVSRLAPRIFASFFAITLTKLDYEKNSGGSPQP